MFGRKKSKANKTEKKNRNVEAGSDMTKGCSNCSNTKGSSNSSSTSTKNCSTSKK